MKKLREINILLEAETDTAWRQFYKQLKQHIKSFLKYF